MMGMIIALAMAVLTAIAMATDLHDMQVKYNENMNTIKNMNEFIHRRKEK